MPGYDNENFSTADINDNNANKTIGYLGTPSGAIKKYDPATGKTTEITPKKKGCK